MLKVVKWKNYKKGNKKNKIKSKMFLILWSLCICISFFKLAQYYMDSKTNKDIRQELIEVYEQINNETNKLQAKTRMEKLQELKQINPDIVALIEIKNTNINYPVVQTINNSFYMTHNYKREKSKDGAIFLDMKYDWKKPSKNLLIYGHNNIGSTEMFSELIKYKSEDFYKNHKIINFTTDEQEEQFEIISVFLSRVYYKKEKDVFRYYYFIDAENEKEFNKYVNNVKKLSLHKIETTAEYQDQLMTLSTCDYSQASGRFVVVARRVMND